MRRVSRKADKIVWSSHKYLSNWRTQKIDIEYSKACEKWLETLLRFPFSNLLCTKSIHTFEPHLVLNSFHFKFTPNRKRPLIEKQGFEWQNTEGVKDFIEKHPCCPSKRLKSLSTPSYLVPILRALYLEGCFTSFINSSENSQMDTGFYIFR